MSVRESTTLTNSNSPVSLNSSQPSRALLKLANSVKTVYQAIRHPIQAAETAASALANRLSPFRSDHPQIVYRPKSTVTLEPLDNEENQIGPPIEPIIESAEADDDDVFYDCEEYENEPSETALTPSVQNSRGPTSWRLPNLGTALKATLFAAAFMGYISPASALAIGAAGYTNASIPNTCFPPIAPPPQVPLNLTTPFTNGTSAAFSSYRAPNLLGMCPANVSTNGTSLAFPRLIPSPLPLMSPGNHSLNGICPASPPAFPSSLPMSPANHSFNATSASATIPSLSPLSSVPTWMDTFANWASWLNGGIENCISAIASRSPDIGLTEMLQRAAASVGSNPTIQQAGTAIGNWSTDSLAWAKANIIGFETAYEYARSAASEAATAASNYPYLAGALAILAIGYVAYQKFKSPATLVSDSSAPLEIYKQRITCRTGTWDVEIPGAKGLKKDEVDALFANYVAEHLEKSPYKALRVGDKLETNLEKESDGSISVNYRWAPKDPSQFTGKPTELTKKITISSNDKASFAKNEILYEVISRRAKNGSILAALVSTKTEILPLNAATVMPVGFTNPDHTYCTLNSIMQAMLATPQILAKMLTCQNRELRNIATQYKERMLENKPALLDLTELRKQFKPGMFRRTTPGVTVDLTQGQQDAHDYFVAILHLMGDPHMQTLFVKQAGLPSPLSSGEVNPGVGTLQARIADSSLWMPEVTVTVGSNLQDAFRDALRGGALNGGLHAATYFDRAPAILPVRVNRAPNSAEMAVPLVLQFPYQHLATDTPLASDVPYELQSFTVYSGNGSSGHEISYTKTYETINGKPTPFYWKIDDLQNQGRPQKIDEATFIQGARKGVNLFYLKQDTIQSSASRFDKRHNPIIRTQGALELESGTLTDTVEKLHEVQNITLPDAQDPTRAQSLRDSVMSALDAVPQTQKSIALPLIDSKEIGNLNLYWVMGIMWHTIQNYLKDHPGRFEKVKIRIRENERVTKEKVIGCVDSVSPDESFSTFVSRFENTYPAKGTSSRNLFLAHSGA